MKSFTYCNPVKIVFGDGVVSQLGAEARTVGRKALLVCGQSSIKKTGLYDKVTASLHDAGVAFVEHGGVRANPVLSHARQGIALARRENVDFIIAVGGGSVIDEAKAIAAGVVAKVDVWDFFCFKASIEAALPVVTLPTMAATGSDTNGGLVLTHDETLDKSGFVCPVVCPKVALLDPTLTYSVPANYVAYSAVDAMAHLMEGYFTHQDEWAPIQDRYVEGLCKTIMEATERILKNPTDAPGRATMMWAASLAWNGLALAGVGPCEFNNHLLEHPLSGLYDVAHGAGLSIVIPAWMTHTQRAKRPTKFVQFAQNVMGVPTAEQGIVALKAWYEKVGSPTSFRAANIPVADLDRLVARTVVLAQMWGMPQYDAQRVREVFSLCV